MDAENKNAQTATQAETKVAAPTAEPVKRKDPETFVRFSKPYRFEGKDYDGIDLAGMESMTAQDMVDAEKYLSRSGLVSPIPELTMEYVGFIANRASGQPLEFFKGLPTRDATRVKNKVTSFFYGED